MPDKPHLLPPPVEEPQQPHFPVTEVHIQPQGMLIQTHLANGITLSQMLSEEDMNKICRQWVETRKQVQQQISTIAAGRRSRND